MNDIEKLLASSKIAKPTRPLRDDFTKKVINSIESNETNKPRRLQRCKEFFTVKIFTKPMIAVLALAVVGAFGSTAYAVVANWPKPTADISVEKVLPSGNKIVKVTRTECISSNNPTPVSYYEVKKEYDKPLEELAKSVRASCEMDAVYDVVNPLVMSYVEKDPQIKHTAYESMTAFKVDAISRDEIKVSSAQFDTERTFRHIAKDVTVYNVREKASFADIKVGDTISTINASDPTLNLEKTDPNRDNTDAQTIIAIVKHPAISDNAFELYTGYGANFVRTEPCDTNKEGFCRVYEFHQ